MLRFRLVRALLRRRGRRTFVKRDPSGRPTAFASISRARSAGADYVAAHLASEGWTEEGRP